MLHAMTITVYREVNDHYNPDGPLPLEAAIAHAAQVAAGPYATVKVGRHLTPVTMAEVTALLPAPGTKVRFIGDVERYPHARVDAGETGTFVEFDGESAWVKLDRYDEGLDEWDNCIQWWEDSLADILVDVTPLEVTT